MNRGLYSMNLGIPVPKVNRKQRPGKRVVCRVCNYGNVTLIREKDGKMICTDCQSLLQRRKR